MNASNMNPSLPIYLQIKILITNLVNKKAYKTSKHDILQLVQKTGSEGEKFMFICLLDSMDFQNKEKLASSVKSRFFMDQISELCSQSSESNFFDYFSNVLETVAPQVNMSPCEYALELFKILRLPLQHQIIISMSLCLTSSPSIMKEGVAILKKRLQEYFEMNKPHIFASYPLSILIFLIRTNPELMTQYNEIKFLLETSINEKGFEYRPLINYQSKENNITVEMNENHSKIERPPLVQQINSYVKPVEFIADLGPQITQNLQIFTNYLKDFSPISEDDIMDFFIHMSNNFSYTEDQTSKIVNNLYNCFKRNSQEDWNKFSNEDILDKKSQLNWNLDVVIQYCNENVQDLNWQRVMKKFDRPQFSIKDDKSFQQIFKTFQKITKVQSNFQFPSSLFFEKWQNSKTQIKFLTQILTIGQIDYINWNELPNKKIANLEFNPVFKYNQLQPVVLQLWACLDILLLLIELSDGEEFVKIRELFEYPVNKCPDILIIGLSQIRPKQGDALLDELFSQLFPNYLSNHVNSIQILEWIWKYNNELLISAICELYKKENKKENTILNLSRVLDITQNIQDSLIALANGNDYAFSVHLGILAGKREFLHFDQWLNDRLRVVGNPFIEQLLNYIEEQVIQQIQAYNQKYGVQANNYNQQNMYENILEKAQLNIELMTLIFESLIIEPPERLTVKNQKRLQESYKLICEFFPSLSIAPEQTSAETEKAANMWFQKIYKEQMTVEQTMQLMQKFKDSKNTQEREIYACMITGLLDESRFHEQYPQKELMLTGQLFGAIINNKLIEGKPLIIALNIISQSLKMQGKRLDFGVKAVENLRERLSEFKQFCDEIFDKNNTNLIDKYPDLLEDIAQQLDAQAVTLNISRQQIDLIHQKALQKLKKNEEQQKMNQIEQVEQVQIIQPNQTNQAHIVSPQPIFQQNTSNLPQRTQTPIIESQVQNQIIPVHIQKNISEPLHQTNNPYAHMSVQDVITQEDSSNQDIPEASKNKIFFNINNLSTKNLDKAANEIRQLIEDEQIKKWFIKHLVVRRALTESQQQQLFIELITKINKPQLFKQLIKESYSLLNKVLQTEKSLSTQEKTQLKNLGGWIGQLTLQRNKPICFKYLNIKSLLAESFQYINRLTIILPIICRILECAKDSIFKLYNPWLNPILCLLEEIKNKEQIKTGIKCEILICFQKLGVQPEKLENKKLLDQQEKKSEQIKSQAQKVSAVKNPVQSPYQAPYVVEQPPKVPVQQNQPLIIPTLPDFVIIDNKNLGVFIQNGLKLKFIVAQALDAAIQDIIPPVISRSVTIALITTRELALKDYALEPDPKNVLRGTRMMVQKLSGSLALVTCREPLRMSLINHLKVLLETHSLEEQEKETIISITVLDNLELGCALIKKAVMEKALGDVNQDQGIMEALEKRKVAKERDELYTDEQYLKEVAFLPDKLRPQPGGLSPSDLKIYEDFQQVQPKKTSQEPSPSQQPEQTAKIIPTDIRTSEKQEKIIQYKQQVLNRFNFLLKQLGQKPEKLKSAQEFIQEVQYLENFFTDMVNCVNMYLFFSKTSQKIEIYIDVIEFLSKASKQNQQAVISSGIKTFVLQDQIPIDQTYSCLHIIINSLYKRQLLSHTNFIETMIDLMTKYQSKEILLCVCKSLNSLIFEEQLVLPNNVLDVIEKLRLIYPKEQPIEEVNQFFEEIKKYSNINNIVKKDKENNFNVPVDLELMNLINDVRKFFSQYDQVFSELVRQKQQEWLQITTESQIEKYIEILQKNFLNQEENIKKFFIYLLDHCVKYALDSNFQGEFSLNQFENLDLSYIDSCSKLIIIILKMVVNMNRNEVLEQICESFLFILIKYHEKQDKEPFNQRPFFKFLLNLIYDIRREEYQFEEADVSNMFNQLVKLFNKLHPLRFPGFSFAWLELISNRYFMPVFLKNHNDWETYSSLIVHLLRFFKTIVNENSIACDHMKTFYKGTLRFLLVLLHDFSDFLSEYVCIFVQEIPDKFIQVRNIILAAFPRNMRPPDPYTVPILEQSGEFQNLPVYQYPAFEQKWTSMNLASLNNDINKYLTLKNEESFNQICNKIITFESDRNQINQQIINIFIMAVPTFIQSKYKQLKDDAFILFQEILRIANLELREVILNSIVNQIRYPNIITHFYITFILRQFLEQDNEQIQEQITRIFVERLIAEPHPWGIMYTFIELIKNARYNFKQKSYFQKKDIEKIFKYVFKSIMQQKDDKSKEEININSNQQQ